MTAYGSMIDQVITNSTTNNMCPLNRINGSFSVGQFVDSMPSIISVVQNNNNGFGLGGINCDSIWSGGCCGSYINGGWNNGLMTFSDIIEDRNEVGFWDSFSAGMKEQLYTNPFGTIGNALGGIGSLGGALGGIGKGISGFISSFLG